MSMQIVWIYYVLYLVWAVVIIIKIVNDQPR